MSTALLSTPGFGDGPFGLFYNKAGCNSIGFSSPVLNGMSSPPNMVIQKSPAEKKSGNGYLALGRRNSVGCVNHSYPDEESGQVSPTGELLTVGAIGSGFGASPTHRKLDRSHSEPVDRISSNRNNPGNSSRYKTELCRPYEENGMCKYGDKCQFAHGIHELRTLARHPKYKTELCRTFHTIGFCPYGPRCHFIHNADESRKHGSVSCGPQPIVGTASRPKARSIGSFSLGSSGDSPPPSLSQSPITTHPFFDDVFISQAAMNGDTYGGITGFSSTPTTPTAQGAFPFSTQDINALVSTLNSFKLSQQPGPRQNNLYNATMHSRQAATSDGQSPPSDDGPSSIHPMTFYIRDCSPPPTVGSISDTCSPPSPAGSLASDLDSVSLSGSPPPMPADLGRNIRLPIFSRLVNEESN